MTSTLTIDSPQQLLADASEGSALDAFDDPATLDAYTQWRQGASGERIGTSQLQISGMHCAACAGIIERALRGAPGVLGADVSAATERLRVQWNPQRTRISNLVSVLARTGYGAVPDLAAPAREMRKRENRQWLWRLFVASFLMMQVMMLATPIYMASPGEMSPDLERLLQWGMWVLSLPVMLFSAGPFFTGAWRQMRARQIGMDVPVALGLIVTFVASTGAVLDPGGLFGREVYFDSLTMFVSFLLAGRFLELKARHKVAQSLESATARLPDQVERRRPDGSFERVSATRLLVGDLVRVPAGQAFPADGLLLEGTSAADESLLTGESRPVEKHPGDELVAGSVNLQAPVLMAVTRIGADTRFEGIVQLMRTALTQRPAQLRIADRMAGPFLWGVLVLAGLAAAAWSVIEPARAVWVAVSVLIVTCPCALSLAAPSAWLAATGALARRGVLLSRLDVLDTLARVDFVVLDKTGTLTQEHMGLVRSWPTEVPREAMAAALSLAAQSLHPYSKALMASRPEGGEGAPQWLDVQEYAGQGMQARDAAGKTWRLGAPAWVAELAEPAAAPAQAQLGFTCDGGPAVYWQFGEQLRPEAREALRRWQTQGLSVLLLSGDAPERAQDMAARVGITRVRGGATPQDKLACVADLQSQGHCVLMVGDGINDAPVLARADASFAMGQGALVSRAHADGVVLTSNLLDVVHCRDLALRTRRVIRQNLVWAACYNAACIPAALLGYLPPWAAGLGMACSSVLVILNALSLARDLRGSAPTVQPG